MRTKKFIIVLAAILSLTFTGCGSSGGGGSSCTFDELFASTFGDLSGTWSYVESSVTVLSGACFGTTLSDTFAVTQSGNTISATSATTGATFTGEISGSQVIWGGSFPRDDGTTTVSCTTMTVNSSTSVTFTNAAWSFSGGGITCTGTTDGFFSKF